MHESKHFLPGPFVPIKDCQWLATAWGFSPVYSTNKTDRHDVTELLLKVALYTIKQPILDIYLTSFNLHITMILDDKYNCISNAGFWEFIILYYLFGTQELRSKWPYIPHLYNLQSLRDPPGIYSWWAYGWPIMSKWNGPLGQGFVGHLGR